MKTKVKEFFNEDDLNIFLWEEKESKDFINLVRNYKDLRVTWDNYNWPVRLILVYETNEDEYEF